MVASIIPLINQMTYDELKDWIDYIEYHFFAALFPDKERDFFLKQVRNRRIGIPTGGFIHKYSTLRAYENVLTMTTGNQNKALTEYEKLSKAEQILLLGQPSAKRDKTESIAWVLLQSKAPVRKTSQGNIQVKWIPYQYIERDEKGQRIKDKDGKPLPPKTVHRPYLYLRYWQQHGDNDKKKSRVKSIYIGGDADFRTRIANFRPNDDYEYPYRALAHLFYDTLQEYGLERKRTIKATGEIQTYKVRPKGDDNPISELEQRIMDCIDMSKVDSIGKDAIDHEALVDLQNELCP